MFKANVASITSSLTKMADQLLILADKETCRCNEYAAAADIQKYRSKEAREEARKATEVAVKIRALVT